MQQQAPLFTAKAVHDMLIGQDGEVHLRTTDDFGRLLRFFEGAMRQGLDHVRAMQRQLMEDPDLKRIVAAVIAVLVSFGNPDESCDGTLVPEALNCLVSLLRCTLDTSCFGCGGSSQIVALSSASEKQSQLARVGRLRVSFLRLARSTFARVSPLPLVCRRTSASATGPAA